MEKDALETQIGGDHYKKMKIQPIELITKLKLNFIQGNVIKYISRDKNNITEDLNKAIHYCELGIELDKIETTLTYEQKLTYWKYVEEYVIQNNMSKINELIIFHILKKEYLEAINDIKKQI